MTPEEPPGVPPIVAVMLVCVVLCLFALGLLVASLLSRTFQRAQERRWARTHVTRFEWLRLNAGMWWGSIVDTIRRSR